MNGHMPKQTDGCMVDWMGCVSMSGALMFTSGRKDTNCMEQTSYRQTCCPVKCSSQFKKCGKFVKTDDTGMFIKTFLYVV